MLIRKTALIASFAASLFGASQAEAGGFGRRNCCQSTPVVCPPCTPSPTILSQATVCGVPSSCVIAHCDTSWSNALQVTTVPTSEMIMGTREETYTVEVPYTEQVEEGGVLKTITRTRQETRTRTVQTAETPAAAFLRLERELRQKDSRDNAQDSRLSKLDGQP